MKFILLIPIVLILGSCFNEGDCLVTATNNMYIQFKKKSNHNTDTAITFAYYSISILGPNIVLKVRPASANLLLPVDIGSDTTTFVFHRINADSSERVDDTLKVSYTRQSKVVTRDCGAFTYYSNLQIQKTSLQNSQIKPFSTSLIKDPTSSAYAVNYQIFY